MQEIKFRAWDKDNKKMLSWLDIKESDKRHTVILCDILDGFWPGTIPIQFTGLHDRNGKEIWEGDILKNEWRKNPHAVVFSDGAFRIGVARLYPAAIVDKREAESSEVIGNIYENPELLEGK